MSTKKFVARLAAYVAALWFLLFFIPWSLNAHDSLINGVGVAVLIGLGITGAAVLHKKSNSNKE